jgi:hypothetical protein
MFIVGHQLNTIVIFQYLCLFLLVSESYLMTVLIDGNTLRRFYIVAQHFMTFYVCRPWNCVMQNVPVCDGYLMT